MGRVESFELDHTKVDAPFIRKVTVYTGAKGDKLTKFDIRFMQPNKEEMDMSGIHTLEHLMAVYLRDEKLGDEIIDLSPMGCRTGFYLTIWGDLDPEDVDEMILNTLKRVTEAEEVPAANEVQCGNAKAHDLKKAKEYSEKFIREMKEKTK
ncbi:MAG: S-ribosylhomocysteine lyase [Andreesenia angusta]|nr:S-ribosylhomocysteine lyase [Andreesenia angusta]